MNNSVPLYIGHLENTGLLTHADLPNAGNSTTTHVSLLSLLILPETPKFGDTCQAFFI